MGMASRRKTSSMAFNVDTVGPLGAVTEVEEVIEKRYTMPIYQFVA